MTEVGVNFPRAVIFDWDNTLVKSWGAIHDALHHTMVTMGAPPWTMEEVRARVKESLRNAFPALFGDRWEMARDIYLQRFESIHLDRLEPLEGAEALLRLLQAEGIWLGLVSNKTGRLLRREIAALGWDRYFMGIVGAGDAERDKPDPAAMRQVLSQTDLTPGPDLWFVGDTEIDIRFALNTGCTPILLHTAMEAAAEMARALDCGADFRCFADLPSFDNAYRYAQSCKTGMQ